jgi:hypothetical protein
MVGLRTGVLDDQTPINTIPPRIEVYVERRPKWVAPVPGATKLNSKYELIENGEAGYTAAELSIEE